MGHQWIEIEDVASYDAKKKKEGVAEFLEHELKIITEGREALKSIQGPSGAALVAEMDIKGKIIQEFLEQALKEAKK